MTTFTIMPQSIFHLFDDTIEGCKQILTSDDKGQALCNTWVTPKKRVTFKGDNVEHMLKPPCETKLFEQEDPPTAISDDECEVKPLPRSKKAWVPPHMRKKSE